MTIDAIFTVLLYSAAPYWGWLLFLVCVPVVSLTILRRFSLRSAKRAIVFSIVVGIVCALLTPTLTGSSLAMLNGAADWVMLMMVAIGATLYCLLVAAIVLQPISSSVLNNRAL
ncbi:MULTISPECIES: hypothetical protein [unclassified Salinivibrio]|uniref:hypothetical protein n=1 Tax=unclassified Salinivibrio TaxID=2636825 RepID=UPI000988CE06|nr:MULTISPECIES: hypothetical protein [unclassified Salinivibrio]NUY55956.1 oxidoreductase [Salinivibrio sp. EAGSL]OOF03275.1 hypothetical protein BZG81_12415 [Salinivibrio sp. MA607]